MKPAVIGVIGFGNMGSAIINGLVGSDLYMPSDIHVTDRDIELVARAESNGHFTNTSVAATAGAANLLIIAVKPKDMADVLRELEAIDPAVTVISVAAGVSIKTIQSFLPKSPVVRVMPNTPAMVGAGVSVISGGARAGEEHLEQARTLFRTLGFVHDVPETLMDAVTGLSGSGPAFAAIMIDALADGGVRMGLSRQDALNLAAETVQGTAKMILDRGIHPDRLRDMVASPGGTTIEGIAVLEERGIRSAFIEAVTAATERSRDLSG